MSAKLASCLTQQQKHLEDCTMCVLIILLLTTDTTTKTFGRLHNVRSIILLLTTYYLLNSDYVSIINRKAICNNLDKFLAGIRMGLSHACNITSIQHSHLMKQFETWVHQ